MGGGFVVGLFAGGRFVLVAGLFAGEGRWFHVLNVLVRVQK
jgi:hypothetical protein